jgi:putative transposase
MRSPEVTRSGTASIGYWVATSGKSGNVTDEVWKKYIEDQKPEVRDDDFKVV